MAFLYVGYWYDRKNWTESFEWSSFYPGSNRFIKNNVTKQVVVRFIKNNIICRYGVPSKIITDNGTNLNNDMVQALCERFKIEHHNSSPYRPQMNGAVEAGNKNIKKIVQKMVTAYKD